MSFSEDEGKFIRLATQSGVINAHYHEVGSGNQYVVFVQTGGAGTTAHMCWYLNMPAFAVCGYHGYAPDVPGFGFTRAVSGQMSRMDFLLTFIDSLGIDRAHFVGNSMGSMMITQFAIEHPDRVASLILTGGEPRVETEESRAIAETLGRTARMNFVREMLSKPEVIFDDIRRATADYFYDRANSKIDEVAGMRLKILKRPGVKEMEREGALKQIQRGRSNFRSSDMQKIQAPTYLIHGRDEKLFYSEETAPILLECAMKATSVIPDCSCAILSPCGHWPQIERAQTFNKLSLEFLGSLKA